MSESRRTTYSDAHAVSYASVGVTQAPDVLVFPPVGFTSNQKEFRIGSGLQRFETASQTIMTWGVVTGSYLELLNVDLDNSERYNGIVFNEFGAPIAPNANDAEELFSPDGTSYLSAGTTVEVSGMWSPRKLNSSYRVIYVIREEKRTGYAWGTIDSAPLVGEELFVAEIRDDDSVWCVVRTVTSISLPKGYKWLTPLVALRHWLQLRQYVKSLLPARTA